jgi:hypothetical protein
MVGINSSGLLALLAACGTLTFAQVPAGVEPALGFKTTAFLDFRFGGNVVEPSGELIPRQETATPPTIGFAFAPTPYASVFLIDQDVLRNGTRMTLLHWFVPNVPLTNGDLFTNPLTVPIPGNGTAGAMYLQPSPPVGDIPHRYVLLLYPQYDGFAIPADSKISPPASTADRIGFNVTAFAQEAGLGEYPVAANWFTVQNTTGVASTTSAITTGAAATATVAPYLGGATMDKRVSWAAGVGGICAAVWCMMS